MGDQITVSRISELSTSGPEQFREEVMEMDPDLEDLEEIKEVEESGQDRPEVMDFIERQIANKKIAKYLGIAEKDLEEIEEIVERIEEVEDAEIPDDPGSKLENSEVLDIVGKNVEDLKSFVEEQEYSSKQLEQILDAEKRVQERKTVIEFLNEELEKREVMEETGKVREDLEELKQDIQMLQEHEDRLGEKSFNSLRQVMDDIRSSESSEGERRLREFEKKLKGEDEEESSSDLDMEKDDEEDELEETDSDDEEEESSQEITGEKSEDEENHFERKRKLAEELELDLSKEEIEEYSVDELETIKDEKEHRKELIEELEGEGLDPDELRQASTRDLEKLAKKEAPDPETKEERDEMREEAEQDLQMLMGAKRRDDEEEEEKVSRKEEIANKIQRFEERIKGRMEEEDEKEEVKSDRFKDVLESYKELEDEEAVIKAAQVTKGFMENSLEIDRELTYKELAEEMPKKNSEMEELADYFLKINREQYTGKLSVDDSRRFINTCISVIDSV